jgi:transcription initiation factor TFIIIB Brf1 subunit/transcription initiation factor TFIIB
MLSFIRSSQVSNRQNSDSGINLGLNNRSQSYRRNRSKGRLHIEDEDERKLIANYFNMQAEYLNRQR